MGKWKFWPKRGFTFKKKTANQQPGRSHINCAPPGFLLWLWPSLDWVISKWLAIEPLRKDKMGIMDIELRRHRGQPIPLDNDTIITPGDMLIELHLNNRWFLCNREKLTDSAGEVRWRVSSAFTNDLRYLARQLAEGRFPAGVSALHGMTTLYSPARHLGFTVVELPESLCKRLTTFYLSGLRRIYYFGKGKEYATQRKPLALKEIWMSKSRLLEKYCP